MGTDIQENNIVLLLDNYSSESRKLHDSFKLAGKIYPTVVIEDDGFLPEDVISVYGFFLGDFSTANGIPGRPRYFNQITVPEFWEISGTNHSGKIHDLNKERGRIFYAEPAHKRFVKIVDWMDERGVVRTSDHYNRYGALYARTIFNAKGHKVNKSYFSASGKEVIVENFVTGNIILNDGDTTKIFGNKTAFVMECLKKAGLTEKRLFFNSLSTPFFVSQNLLQNQKGDVLFWQEPIKSDIPGNMQMILKGQSTRVGAIKVQKKHAYDRLLELGADETVVQKLGFIYRFEKQNQNTGEVLICTNSDKIEHCEELVKALPMVHFHITAITEMSSKLMSMGNYENVTLYPNVKTDVLKELFAKCDYYFDINYGNEIVSAVQKAFLNNQLILAFQDTLHNRDYVAPEHIYSIGKANEMIAEMKKILADDKVLQKHLKLQHEWAMLEPSEIYQNL